MPSAFDEGWFEEVMTEQGFAVTEELVCDGSPHNRQCCASYFHARQRREECHG